ncbi:MAG: hypothetical protein JW839_19015 [Candidatus Lokiarchaeota archaeon]|nr:hypothetical protein [Candidatus Lokiarchaeota archaeon]
MASTTPDPDASILLDTVSRREPISIYDLAHEVKWSYGKTERKVAELIKGGKLHSRARVERGRNSKLLSLHPIPSTDTSDTKASSSGIPPVVKDAFVHLYGIFQELNEVGIDPTTALLSYGNKQGMTSDAIIALLDEARGSIPDE